MRHKVAAALQLGTSGLTGRASWRLRQLVRTGLLKLRGQTAADEFATIASIRLTHMPIESFLPSAEQVRRCYSRLADRADASIKDIEITARQVCRDDIRLRGIGKIEIRYEASNWYSYAAEDSIMVNRHDFLLPLVRHFVLSDSLECRRKLNELFAYWIESFNVRKLHQCDTPIDSAIRLINWLWVFNSNALELDREAALKLGRIIFLQVEFIHSRFSAGGNHLVLESLAVFIYGCLFCESRAGDRWKSWGSETLRSELFRQTTKDGVHSEQSMFYHQAVTTHFLKFFLTAAKFEVSVEAAGKERFRRMLNYVHDTTMPDLTHPVVGDGEALVTEDREHWEARSLLAARWSMFQEPVDTSLVNMIDDSSIWLIGESSVDVGTASDTLKSTVYPDSGLAVFRARNAFVFVDAAPFSDPEFPHHGHADALSFVSCVGGDQLLIDPGGYGYYDDDFRRFFRSTAAHNTITVDGRDQSELFGVLGYGRLANARIENVLLTDDVDGLVASHDGYRPIGHRRGFFLCKRPHPVLVIYDCIAGPGTHRAVSRFHAAPGVKFNIEENQLVSKNSSYTFNFSMASSLPVERRVQYGRRDSYVQGWVSPQTRNAVPAETLELAFDTQGDCQLVAAFALECDIAVDAKLGAAGTAEVSIGEHAYSLACTEGRLSAGPL